MDWLKLYRSWNISFFPLKERDKKPAIKWEEYTKRHPTEDEIEYWKNNGTRNYGAVCGSISGNLVVIDVDKEELFTKLSLGELANATFTVKTGKGYHLYVRTDKPMKRKSLMWEKHEELRFQGEGSYVVMCGSVHPTGREYEHLATSPLEIRRVKPALFEEIEKRWKSYHGLDKIEEKGRIVALKSKRSKPIEEFKERVGMDIIKKYVEPKRVYGDYWQGLCPFHDDHEPSFTVYEQTNTWHCFGCERGGDIISFIEEKEGLDFTGAVRKIEELTGVSFLKRDEEKKRISHSALAELIMEGNRFITLRDTEEVLWWDGRKWKFGGEVRIKELLQHTLQDLEKERISVHLVNEVIAYIQRSTYVERFLLNREKRKIPLLNGVYDLETDQLLPLAPEYYFTYCLPVEYNKSAKCEKIEKFLSEVLHPDDIPPVLEFVGYCMIPEQKMQKAVMFLGEGSNGKSTMIELIRAFLGRENTAAIPLQELTENRFASASLYGKLANLSSDLPASAIRKTGFFKMLTGGDTISAEKKFKDHFEFLPTAKLIFSANQLPMASDTTIAFFRRWILVSFPNRFEGKKRDPNILERLTTSQELSGFFNLVLKHLKSLLTKRNFSNSKVAEEIMEDYIRKSNPVLAFVHDVVVIDPKGYATKDATYSAFVSYCKDNRLPVVSKGRFGSLLQGYAPVKTGRKTIGGKRVWCWEGMLIKKKEEEQEILEFGKETGDKKEEQEEDMKEEKTRYVNIKDLDEEGNIKGEKASGSNEQPSEQDVIEFHTEVTEGTCERCGKKTWLDHEWLHEGKKHLICAACAEEIARGHTEANK
ncbi:hypothetical protein DRH14_04130 [Candidatus Shapirobacteria bacterium]|nr:MAG: hypothetical protein DRH14_04130 [Candidatus Shapirobacteria bacterium]